MRGHFYRLRLGLRFAAFAFGSARTASASVVRRPCCIVETAMTISAEDGLDFAGNKQLSAVNQELRQDLRLSVSVVLVCGEILPSAVFTGPNQPLALDDMQCGRDACVQAVVIPRVLSMVGKED